MIRIFSFLFILLLGFESSAQMSCVDLFGEVSEAPVPSGMETFTFGDNTLVANTPETAFGNPIANEPTGLLIGFLGGGLDTAVIEQQMNFVEDTTPETPQWHRPEDFEIQNLPQIQKENRQHQQRLEENPPVQAYFIQGQLDYGIAQPDAWLQDLLDNNESAYGALRYMSRMGRTFRSRSAHFHHTRVFQKLLQLSAEEFHQLQPRVLLEIYKLHSEWHVIPPSSHRERLEQALRNSMPSWSPLDHSQFAYALRQQPARLATAFMIQYVRQLRSRFEDFPAETQMTVFTTLIMHRAPVSGATWKSFIRSLRINIKSSGRGRLSENNLRNTLRGALALEQLNAGSLHRDLERLMDVIHRQLRKHGYELHRQGTGGNETATQLALERRLAQLLGDNSEENEFSDPTRAGTFEPRDTLFSPSLILLEWDGQHHFFKPLNEDGTVSIYDIQNWRQHRADTFYDELARRDGYIVFRYSRALLGHPNDLTRQQLIDEIRRQNPQHANDPLFEDLF